MRRNRIVQTLVLPALLLVGCVGSVGGPGGGNPNMGSGGSPNGGGGSPSGGGGSGGNPNSGGGSGSDDMGVPPGDSPDLADPAGLTWSKANLTNFESYPAPGSPECVNFNGCMWAGQFAFVQGKQTEAWVMQHNIIAVHSKDANMYALKTLRLRQGSLQIDATVYDMCSDSDCNGCCTHNATQNGLNFLIDIEKYTMQRFGSGDGIVDWACLDCN